MNKTIKKFLLTEDIFELRLKQPGFIHSACGTFTKHRERIQKVKDTGSLKHIYIYRNELDKVCFAYDAAYSDGKYLDRFLKDRAYEIARNCGYDGYQRALASIV